MQENFIENFFWKAKKGLVKETDKDIELDYYTVAHALDNYKTIYLRTFEEFSGIVYQENSETSVSIFPIYRGIIVSDFEISRGSDLYKPKTEEKLLEKMYTQAYQLNNILSSDTYKMHGYYIGSFEDYMFKLKQIIYYLRQLR